jgi:hypothetical protein
MTTTTTTTTTTATKSMTTTTTTTTATTPLTITKKNPDSDPTSKKRKSFHENDTTQSSTLTTAFHNLSTAPTNGELHPRSGLSKWSDVAGDNDGDADEEPMAVQLGIIVGWSGRGTRKPFIDLTMGVGVTVRYRWKARPGFSPIIFGTVAFTEVEGAVAEIALIDRNDASFPSHTRRWLQAVVVEVDPSRHKTVMEIASSVSVYGKRGHLLSVRTKFLGSEDFVVGTKVLLSTQRFKTNNAKEAVGIDTCEADPSQDEISHRFAPNAQLLTKLGSSLCSNFVIGDRRANDGMLGFKTGDISFIDTSSPAKIIPQMIDFATDRCEKELAAWDLVMLAAHSTRPLPSTHLRPRDKVRDDLEVLEKARSGSRPLNFVIFPHSFKKIHPDAWPEIIDAFESKMTPFKVNSFALLEVLDRSLDKGNFFQLCDRGFRLSPLGSAYTRSTVYTKDISLGYMTSRGSWTFSRSSSSHRVAFHHFATHMVLDAPVVDFVDLVDDAMAGDGQSDDEDCSPASVIASASQKDIEKFPGLLRKLQSFGVNSHRRNTDFAHHKTEFQHFTVLTDNPDATAASIRDYSPNGFSPFAAITFKELSSSKNLVHIGFGGAPTYTALVKVIGQVPALCKSKVITIVWDKDISTLTKLLHEANEELAKARCVRPFVAVVEADSAPLWIIEKPVSADVVGLEGFAPVSDYDKLIFIDGPQPGVESPAMLRTILLHHGADESSCEEAQWRRGTNDSSSFWLCVGVKGTFEIDGITLRNGQKTVTERPPDTVHVHYVFRKQSSNQPLESLEDYTPLPPSLLYTNAQNSYHNFYVPPPQPSAKPSASRTSDTVKRGSATSRPRRNPPHNKARLAPVFEEPRGSNSSDHSKSIARDVQQGVAGSADAAPKEEVIRIKGVISKINSDKPKEPPMLYLRVLWRCSGGTGKESMTDEPCDISSAMSLQKSRAWVGVSANLFFAKREARKGAISFLKDDDIQCEECTKFSKSSKKNNTD